MSMESWERKQELKRLRFWANAIMAVGIAGGAISVVLFVVHGIYFGVTFEWFLGYIVPYWMVLFMTVIFGWILRRMTLL